MVSEGARLVGHLVQDRRHAVRLDREPAETRRMKNRRLFVPALLPCRPQKFKADLGMAQHRSHAVRLDRQLAEDNRRTLFSARF